MYCKLLKDYIVFAEQEEELRKFILRQHQTVGVEKVVQRALDPKLTRGLIWHTQGSGKTFTMIKSAELLFKAPEAEKPTILMMIDRNELEDQMLKNLASLGLNNVEHAHSIARLTNYSKTTIAASLCRPSKSFRACRQTSMNERISMSWWTRRTVQRAVILATI